MKSKLEKYVLEHLTDDEHHFSFYPSDAKKFNLDFESLCDILMQLDREGKFMVFPYGDYVECERFPPCTIPTFREND